MLWPAELDLNYEHQQGRTVLRHRHQGPLRCLKSLYPEGEAICHNVVVHPPGGLVGGDTLAIRLNAGAHSHALISTPGATRFYGGDGLVARQTVSLTLAEHARVEWLPLETLAYPGCSASNHWCATLAPTAELMAWDVLALGLPSAGQPFDTGQFHQHLEIAGLWLERAQINASDTRLFGSPLGMAGQRCLGNLVFASGTALHRERREHLLERVRHALVGCSPELHIAATCPNPQMLVVRGLSPLAEPLVAAFQRCWAALREHAWALPHAPPRIWAV